MSAASDPSPPVPSTLPVVAVVGPTASGKSELGLELAQRLGGEVVNADAMQLYRGMDIGTAKLPPTERRGIPHHQLDVLDVRAEASVAAYQRAARADLAAIRERDALPLLVGGSGLYVRAALDRLEIPPTDPAVRQHFEGELARWGARAMHARLGRLDPTAAEQIEPANGRRLVRALEVITLTGRPFSATMPAREFVAPTVVLGLRVPREELDERIGRRVERMWAAGLLDEVRELDRQGLREGRTASKALGYREALAHLGGELSAQEAQEQTATATRRLARRQQSWFRPDPRITWLGHDDPKLVDRALEAVRRAAQEGTTMGRDD
ncbi:MAG TPA: tRNA (adenosine(37)-N6)-dimethylallyltransferase MiaA [Segeticoccus sp.]|uniref:tRNA (adenosine(37)-N6)-dimethylallyltransferase MiaA n=1 Tax=Segeticoccus sp. TaxID=2706531 RepID=UPI002D80407E|nr:tRNA (adenosine(37)-N6)-dimethylallyltransferase MiaA [Segeticoccus sp.]HET8600035.1 tRNA (adenosine(37)-N6)-dimethylallyltransferase MiaA [Segeticoccus sp.]